MTTSADIRWAFKYYLGREPDAEAADFHVRTESGYADPQPLKSALFASLEARHWQGIPQIPGEFCIWRPGRPRVMVLGNCQGPNLGRSLAALADVSVYAIDFLNFLDKTAMVETYLEDADIVLSPWLGPEFGALSGAALKKKFGEKLGLYGLVYFGGIHPDVTYLGSRGNRIASPLGDYHSAIVIRSVLSGFDRKACSERFAAEIADGKNHKQAYEESRDAFQRREEVMNIRIADWFFSAIRQQPLLYIINHPMAEVFAAIVQAAARYFSFDCRLGEPPITQNDLSRNAIWPVHRGIAASVGLSYSTPDVFWIDRYMMDLDEFIWRSYKIYGDHDPVLFKAAASERNLRPFI